MTPKKDCQCGCKGRDGGNHVPPIPKPRFAVPHALLCLRCGRKLTEAELPVRFCADGSKCLARALARSMKGLDRVHSFDERAVRTMYQESVGHLPPVIPDTDRQWHYDRKRDGDPRRIARAAVNS